MKVLGLVGSPRKGGNSEAMVAAVLKGAANAGAETKMINLTQQAIGGCTACMYCRKHGSCSIKDGMQEIYRQIDAADAVVLGFPIYMFTMNAQTKTFVDRLFPYIDAQYKSRFVKKTVLAVAQGNAETGAFAKNLEWVTGSLGFLGFPVVKTLVGGNGNEAGSFAKRPDLMHEAEQAGASLATPLA
jgi:multimeric flavodoxin WrbA